MLYSSRFVRAFVHQLNGYPGFPAARLERIRASEHDERVDVEGAHASLMRWVKGTEDPDLGLKAGSRMRLGWGGPLDYAIHSAASVRQGLTVAADHARLFSDALRPRLEVEGNRAMIYLDNEVEWPRVAADFTLSAWYTNHIRVQLPEDAEVECWVAHEPPAALEEYARAFRGATLRFGMPHYGFAFDVDYLDRPLESADPFLHGLHREHLSLLEAGLPRPRAVAQRVREIVAGDLSSNASTAQGVARQLQMSARTLARKLEREGTSFTGQRDEVRRVRALRYVACVSLPLNEIAGLLGFSNVQAFYRAFKRWTGRTPVEYRRTARQDGTLQPYV